MTLNFNKKNMDFPDLGGFKVNLPTISGIASNGVFAAIGFFLEWILGFLLIIWIGFSIYAAFKIITSQMAEGLEEGVKIIKNIWIGISIGLLFMISLSFIGAFVGFGNITEWHHSLAQCHDATGGFFFKEVQEQYAGGLPQTSNYVYCCKVTADLKTVAALKTNYKDSSFKKDTWHYIVTKTNSAPSGSFSDCEEYK
jgi:hypothetical protein